METHFKFVIILVVFAVSGCKVQSEVIDVDDGDSYHIQCPANQGIHIDSAIWKAKILSPTNAFYQVLDATEILTGHTPDDGVCFDWMLGPTMNQLCQGRNECVLKATKPGCDFVMYLRVEYSCLPCESSRHRRGIDQWGHVISVVCMMAARFPGNCPHRSFVAKHVCTDCTDNESVERFADNVDNNVRNIGRRTQFNSVFLAPAMTYSQDGDNCVFDFAVPKYNCRLTDVWRCVRRGYFTAYHRKSDGHYLDRLDAFHGNHNEFKKK